MDAAEDEERPLLHHQSPQDVCSKYTSDGSLDINNQPALKNNTGNWRACFMILGIEFGECTAFFSIANNLVTYLTTVLHESKVAAAKNTSAWAGTCFLTPLIGAFMADTYWGRYWTIVIFITINIVVSTKQLTNLIYLMCYLKSWTLPFWLGMVVLTISVSLRVFSAASYHGHIHPAMVYLGLYLTALGNGGVKPCLSPFGADQFDSTDPQELVKKGSFFSWYYFMIRTSSLLSGTLLVWLQDNVGWGISFAIPTVLMLFSLIVFFTGSRVYRYRKIGVSPLISLCQVVVAAIRKCHQQLPDDSSLLYELTVSPSETEASDKIQKTNQFRFLDKAAIVLSPSNKGCMSPASSWKLCTVTQVEELKMLLRMSPIWASFVIFYAVSLQMGATLVEEGMFMDNRVGPFAIPPASLSIFGVLSVLIWVPIYETVLVPFSRRFTGKEKGFSQMQRIGIGLALSILTMVYSALLEKKRLEIARASGLTNQNVPVQMNILWQAPAYFLHGAADVFSSIGMMQFFYDQAPDKMRSLCSAFGNLSIASGSYFDTFLFGIIATFTSSGGAPGWIPDNLNEGHLDYFYWMMAALSFLNLVYFVHCSMRYRGKTTS